MALLPEEELIWSPVVANSSMNRERGASGANSYEKELKLQPASFLAEARQRQGHAAWLDLCCGAGNALRQTAAHFAHLSPQDGLTLLGVDLVDAFRPVPPGVTCLTFTVASVVDWLPPRPFDLITCSHGLHYLGDKLQVLARSVASLRPGGVFVAHLDLANLVVEQADTRRVLLRLFRAAGLHYSARHKLLRCVGPAELQLPLRYLGADDAAGPNYSGQPAVTSHYALI